MRTGLIVSELIAIAVGVFALANLGESANRYDLLMMISLAYLAVVAVVHWFVQRRQSVGGTPESFDRTDEPT